MNTQDRKVKVGDEVVLITYCNNPKLCKIGDTATVADDCHVSLDYGHITVNLQNGRQWYLRPTDWKFPDTTPVILTGDNVNGQSIIVAEATEETPMSRFIDAISDLYLDAHQLKMVCDAAFKLSKESFNHTK